MKKFNEYYSNNNENLKSIIKYFFPGKETEKTEAVLYDDTNKSLQVNLESLGSLEKESFYRVNYSSSTNEFPAKKYDLLSIEHNDYTEDIKNLVDDLKKLNANSNIDIKGYPEELYKVFIKNPINIQLNYYNKKQTFKWGNGITSCEKTTAGINSAKDTNILTKLTELTTRQKAGYNNPGTNASTPGNAPGNPPGSSGQGNSITNNSDIDIVLEEFGILNSNLIKSPKGDFLSGKFLFKDDQNEIYASEAKITEIKENNNIIDLSTLKFKSNHNYVIVLIINNNTYKISGNYNNTNYEIQNNNIDFININNVDILHSNYVNIADKVIALYKQIKVKYSVKSNQTKLYSNRPPRGNTFDKLIPTKNNHSIYEFDITGTTGVYRAVEKIDISLINTKSDLEGFRFNINDINTNTKTIINITDGEIVEKNGNWEITKKAAIKFSDVITEGFLSKGYNMLKTGLDNVKNKTFDLLKSTNFKIKDYPMFQNYLIKISMGEEFMDFIIRKILNTTDDRILCRLCAMNNCKYLSEKLLSSDIDGKNFLISFKNENVKEESAVRLIRIYHREVIYKLSLGFINKKDDKYQVDKNYLQGNINLLVQLDKSYDDFINEYNICITKLKKADSKLVEFND
jgi:hypothetical protein